METPPAETRNADAAAPAAPPTPSSGPSAMGGVLRLLLPAILAAGAAYGGTRGAAAKIVAPAEPAHTVAAKPPGPTLPLDPFLVTLFDASKKPHPMKMSIAVEFDANTKEDLRNFVPRIRDAVLSHLRTLTHEQATDPAHIEKLRVELVERCRAVGATGAERILVTDFVVQ